MTYTTNNTIPYYQTDTGTGNNWTLNSGSTYDVYQLCNACKRTGELTSRGLCEECDVKIPEHIPEKQYNKYIKQVWRKQIGS